MDVGSELRRARQARGMSVETLAATTRIQARVIAGLERNDLSVIPPRPYARGFVAAYAREVGLNPDQTVREYFAQFDTAHTAEVQGPPPDTTPPVPPVGRPVMALLGVAMLVVSAIVLMWQPGALAPRDRDVVGTTGSLPPAAPELVLAASPDRAATAPVVTPSPQPQEIVAVIEAEHPAWVAATADGTRVLYRTLQPGARETVRARRAITIRVGDAGAVRLSIDGGAATPMGRRGEVRTVTLGLPDPRSPLPDH